MTIWQDMQLHLDELAAAQLLRRPVVVESACGATVTVGGRQVVCLCANDYLGLADDPAVKAAAIEAVGKWGVGAGASRLVSGTTSLHVELERRLAQFKCVESALVTPTGWMANHVAVHALAGGGDAIFCDKLNHASIIDAALSSGARVRTYPHRDTGRLARLLDRHRAEHRRCLIVTDSLFSMDGDAAPLRDLVELKKRFDAQLLIDEAHATGVFGGQGRGLAEAMGVEGDIDATVGTLSKALGSLGGFVAGPSVLVETIRNGGRAYMFTTSPPPALCAAAIAALNIIRDQPDRRRRLLSLAASLRQSLLASAAGCGPQSPHPALTGQALATPLPPPTQIIPVIVGQAARAIALSKRLLEEGFLVPAIRPPTVPKGASRLRVSLCANHSQGDLDRFVRVLARAWPEGDGRS